MSLRFLVTSSRASGSFMAHVDANAQNTRENFRTTPTVAIVLCWLPRTGLDTILGAAVACK